MNPNTQTIISHMRGTSLLVILMLPIVAEWNVPLQAADAPHQPHFYFRDRSKVAGDPSFENLQVETSYGTLQIPRDQIIQVRFAFRLHVTTTCSAV